MAEVSVIVPAYNAERYISVCLDSLRKQTFRDFEVYVCDDGSCDDTRRIALSYSDIDSRFHCIALEHCNAGAARNAGMSHARGDYLYFLDADDYLSPRALEALYGAAISSSADVVVARSVIFDDVTGASRPLSWAMVDVPTGICLTGDSLPQRPFQSFIGWPWDKMFSRSFVIENELKFQGLRSTNDAYFVFMALCKARSMFCIDEELFYHRTNSRGSLEKTRSKSWNNAICAMTAIRDSLPKNTSHWVSFVNWVSDFSYWSMISLDSEGLNSNVIDSFMSFVSTVQMPREQYYSQRDADFADASTADRLKLIGMYMELRKEHDLIEERCSTTEKRISELENTISMLEAEKMGIVQSRSYRLARMIAKFALPFKTALGRDR